MNEEKHKEILKNRAKIESAANCYCDNCGEHLIFAMQDNYHQFSVTIEDILVCLRIAEKNGAVPKLHNDWCTDTLCRYDGLRL